MSEFGWNYIGKGMGVARRVVLTEKRAKSNAVQINHLGKIIKRLPVNMIPTRSIMSERASERVETTQKAALHCQWPSLVSIQLNN